MLGRIAFYAFAQQSWGCKEPNPKQIGLFEKEMFIEIGFNIGAIAGEAVVFKHNIGWKAMLCSFSASLTSVRSLWMCCALLQPRSYVGHGGVCVSRLSIAVYSRRLCELWSFASIT